MKKNFQIPEIDVARFEAMDVITTSGGDGDIELPGEEL